MLPISWNWKIDTPWFWTLETPVFQRDGKKYCINVRMLRYLGVTGMCHFGSPKWHICLIFVQISKMAHLLNFGSIILTSNSNSVFNFLYLLISVLIHLGFAKLNYFEFWCASIDSSCPQNWPCVPRLVDIFK